MRFARMLGLASMVVLFSGCMVLSLHPLHSPDVVVTDRDIEGTWEQLGPDGKEVGNRWVIAANGSAGYDLRVIGGRPETSETYTAVLAQIGEYKFLDLQPIPQKPPACLTTIATHLFVRMRESGESLRIEICDLKKLEAAVRKSGGALSGESVDGRYVLTSKTPALQAFFRAHANEVFGESILLRRKRAVDQ